MNIFGRSNRRQETNARAPHVSTDIFDRSHLRGGEDVVRDVSTRRNPLATTERFPSTRTASDVVNRERRLQDAGVQTETPRRKTLLQRVGETLDTLDRPVRTFVGELLRGADRGTAFRRAGEALRKPERAMTGEEIVDAGADRLGVPRLRSRVGRFIAGAGAEMLLAPTSLIGVGKVSTTKRAIANRAARAAAKGTDAPLHAIKVMGRDVVNLPRVGKAAQRVADKIPGVNRVQDALGEVFNFRHIGSGTRGAARETVRQAQDVVSAGVREAGYQAQKGIRDTARGWRGFSRRAAEEAGTIIEEPRRQRILRGEGKTLPPLVAETPENLAAANKARASFDADVSNLERAGISLETLEHYFTHLFKDSPEKVQQVMRMARRTGDTVRTQDRPFFMRERIIPTMELAEKSGLTPIKDARVVTAVHRALTNQTVAIKNMTDDLLGMGDEVLSRTPREGYVQIQNSLSQNIDGMYMHPDVARMMRNMMPVLLNKDAGVRNLSRLFDASMSGFKTLVIGYNPMFHVRQFVGNLMLNIADGVTNPYRYGQATALLAGKLDGATLDGVRYTREQLMEEFMRRGLQGSGAFSELHRVGDVTRDALREVDIVERGVAGHVLHSMRPVATEMGKRTSPIIQGMNRTVRRIGEGGDTFFRFTNFLDKVDSGMDFDNAAAAVRRALFDYSELTEAEKNIRRFLVPFYAWTRKSVPRLLERIAGAPGFFSGYHRMRESMFRDTREQAEATGFGAGWVKQEDIPRWMNETGMIPISTDDRGNVFFVNFNLPLHELDQIPLMGDPVEETGRTVLSRLNPLLTALYSMGTNQDIFSGRRITETPDIPEEAAGDYARYLLSQAGPLARTFLTDPVVQRDRAASADAEAARGIGQEIPEDTTAQRMYMGLVRRQNPAQTARQQLYQRRDELQQMTDVADQRGIVLPELDATRAGDFGTNIFGRGTPERTPRPLGAGMFDRSLEAQSARESLDRTMRDAARGQTSGLLHEAARRSNVPEDWLPYLEWLMNQQGGNPFAITGSQAEGRRIGLFQISPEVFSRFSTEENPNIFNPLHNSMAAIKYIRERYGHPVNIPRIGQPNFGGY